MLLSAPAPGLWGTPHRERGWLEGSWGVGPAVSLRLGFVGSIAVGLAEDQSPGRFCSGDGFAGANITAARFSVAKDASGAQRRDSRVRPPLRHMRGWQSWLLLQGHGGRPHCRPVYTSASRSTHV